MDSEQIIEIKGESVQLVTRQVTRLVTLSSWIDQLQRKEPISTPILPKGCRKYKQLEGGSKIYVVECDPTIRTIEWNRMEGCETTAVEAEFDGERHNRAGERYKRDVHNRWRLAFPYVVFKIAITASGAVNGDYCYVYYRKEPLSSTSKDLHASNLGNLYHDHRICTGDMRLEEELKSDAEKVDDFIGKFWTSPFNADLLEHYLNGGRLDRRLKTLTSWQEASIANPLFMLEVNWIRRETLE